MIKEIFAVLDMCAERYMEPFFFGNVAEALRSFGAACGDPETRFAQHPSDYALYHVGAWNSETGVITSCEPHVIGKASSYVQAETPEGPRIDERAAYVREEVSA